MVAFTREESAETAAEVELPDRPISPHPNSVTESGLEALANAMAEWRAAYNAAQQIEDAGERRRAVAVASREMRYFADRLRTAQVVPQPTEFGAIAFGHQVTFKRDHGRRQAFQIVGEDEADPRNGSISYVSPVARANATAFAATWRCWFCPKYSRAKSERSIRMTLSLAFLSPVLAEAAMEGRLPRGFSVKRLVDLPMLWSEQWRAIGLQEPAQVRAELG